MTARAGKLAARLLAVSGIALSVAGMYLIGVDWLVISTILLMGVVSGVGTYVFARGKLKRGA